MIGFSFKSQKKAKRHSQTCSYITAYYNTGGDRLKSNRPRHKSIDALEVCVRAFLNETGSRIVCVIK